MVNEETFNLEITDGKWVRPFNVQADTFEKAVRAAAEWCKINTDGRWVVIDMRERCCYIDIGSVTVYIDWSLDELIVETWENENAAQ